MNKTRILLVILLIITAVLFYNQTLQSPKTADLNQTPENTKQPGANTDKNVLDLSNQGLQKLPAYVFKMTDLEELNISNNQMGGALPAEIHDLRNLHILDASDNLMTGIPAEIGQLQNLEILNLSNNKLTGLPYELGNLKKLKVLNLSGNNYAKQDLEIIKKGLSLAVEIIL